VAAKKLASYSMYKKSDYLSKKPLFFRRKDDEKFKEKNPFRQVPINAPSHWPIAFDEDVLAI